jgi:hypothetical protein
MRKDGGFRPGNTAYQLLIVQLYLKEEEFKVEISWEVVY